jgi:ribosomal protein S18 acetylase RimI-like enzyme
MNFELRRYRRAELPDLTQAINAVCAEGMMETPRFQPTPAWQHALDDPDCPHHLLLVAGIGERIIGWSRLFPKEADEADQVELGIGVVGDSRRRGVGKSLLHSSLNWAKRHNRARVLLSTRADNEAAIQLFAQSGFQIVDEKGELLEMAFLPEYIPKRGVKS